MMKKSKTSDIKKSVRTTKKAGKSNKSEEPANNVKDENRGEEFPGYPHYPASDDILEQTGTERVNVPELDNTSAVKSVAPDRAANMPETNRGIESDEDNDDTVPASDADITKEDLLALDDNLVSDLGDDDLLKDRIFPVDMAAEDLDIPGAELDDEDEMIGEEDEENNSYSIGGDRHEGLEENGAKRDTE